MVCVHLVRYVIHGILLYCLKIYEWSLALLSILDSYIWIFVWTCSIYIRKIVIVFLNNVCTLIYIDILGLRKIKNINKVGCLAIGWNMITTNKKNRSLPLDACTSRKKPIKHHISSLLWFGLNHTLNYIEDHRMWKVRNDKDFFF